MFLNVDIEESSISNHPDIEVETSISTFLQYRGTSISKYTNDDIDTYSFDIEVAYRTRYRRHKSKRRYRRFMMPISAYTDIGYKTSISTSWQGSRCGFKSASISGTICNFDIEGLYFRVDIDIEATRNEETSISKVGTSIGTSAISKHPDIEDSSTSKVCLRYPLNSISNNLQYRISNSYLNIAVVSKIVRYSS
jgi:hypothetical protein